jgi:hypothetical protein
MKTEKILVFAVMLFLLQLAACERSEVENAAPDIAAERAAAQGRSNSGAHIEAEKVTGIKLKEPAEFRLVNGLSPYVKWRTLPEQIVHNLGTNSVIHFQQPGKYRVFAIDSIQLDTAFIDIEVINETYHYVPNPDSVAIPPKNPIPGDSIPTDSIPSDSL